MDIYRLLIIVLDMTVREGYGPARFFDKALIARAQIPLTLILFPKERRCLMWTMTRDYFGEEGA
jgi:hypothetical protein